ncbi:MAG: DNRLRE domain-containing protein [Bacteroidetes bacterium]|nr:DNRLRE domain-containing protein [Bacteroidota bacterium]
MLVFVVVGLFIGFVSYSQDTLILQPGPLNGKDADIRDDYPYNPSPTSPDFIANAWTVGGIPFIQRSLIEFDLSALPANSILISATLSLYANIFTGHFQHHSSLSGSNRCYLKKITEPWSDLTVCWSNQPQTTNLHMVIIPESISPLQDYPDIDVTQLIQDILDDPSAGFGFLFQLETEELYRSMIFASSDNSDPDLYPKLTIVYEVEQSTQIVSQGCYIGNYSFQLADTAQVQSVIWSFGDPGSSANQSTLLNPSHTFDIAGTYVVTVTVTYHSGQIQEYQTTVIINEGPDLIEPSQLLLCENNPLSISIPGSYSNYIWSNGQSAPGITIDSPGMYSVTATASNGCVISDSVLITSPAPLFLSIGYDSMLCIGETLQVKPLITGQYDSLVWNDGWDNINRNIINTGEYTLKLFYSCGEVSDTINVDFGDCESEIWFPNCFTPNGDVANPYFLPKYKNITDYEMVVYNRWGQLIFTTHDLDNGWDGTYKGSECAVGVYFYMATFTLNRDLHPVRQMDKGSVTLLR